MKISRKNNHLVYGLLMLLPFFAISTSAAMAATEYKVHFRALSFSMACNPDTPKKQEKYYPRASGTEAGLSEHECVDTRRQLVGLKPKSIGVRYDSVFDKFEVVIYLDPADAKGLSRITKKTEINERPERVLIGADGGIVASGYLNEPFKGDSFYISADSHEAAHKLASCFVDKLVKQP